ncbi:MAG TPA: mismatch-specific DNA-glycosylase [Nitrospiraceae bacterium]|jgi:TDG/mug DNA glycosylase family protein|nr:mismatch-specific DNA-glycosylase [Nitrospiraceae bacterium]
MGDSKQRYRRIRDCIQPGVLVLFVGINPGLRSAQTGHHFAGYSNRFWRLLHESKLVSEPLTYREDRRLPEWRLGLTNIIGRCTTGINVLDPVEYRRGVASLKRRIRRYQPHIVALLGVTIFRMLFSPKEQSKSPLDLGLTTMQLAGARIFLLPNPSGRNAHYSYRQMLTAFLVLRDNMERSRRKHGPSTMKDSTRRL